jgi:hypothetical protein
MDRLRKRTHQRVPWWLLTLALMGGGISDTRRDLQEQITPLATFVGDVSSFGVEMK